jgi:hypothetical protein
MLVVEARRPRCKHWNFPLGNILAECPGTRRSIVGLRWVGADTLPRASTHVISSPTTEAAS